MPTARPLDAAPGTAASRSSPWRMPPAPAPVDWSDSPWARALIGLVALGLLLAFCKVVSNGVQRGERLRSQFASGMPACEALAPDELSLTCRDLAAETPIRNAQAAPAARNPNPMMLATRQ